MTDIDRLNQIVNDYEALRERIYEAAAKDRKNLFGWLATAFTNEGEDGIKGIEAKEDGLHVWGTCWTNQTGGSYEHYEFVLPYEAVEIEEAKSV